MLKLFELKEWLPDLAPSGTLTIATNVRPIANGYAPIPGFQAVTDDLGATFSGGAAFVDSTGTSTFLSATAAALRKYSGGWTDVATLATTARWRFAQFGDNVGYANGGTMGVYDLIAGTVSTPTAAPALIDIFRVRDFLMGITTDNSAQWCQFNDSSTWTTGTNQADTQPLLGGQGVAGVGGEYGIIFRKNGIDRVTYVGAANDIIFQFDEISAEYGCMAQGSVTNTGRLIFFLSERGFALCDGETVVPIAEEKFNRWFFSTYAREEIENIWSGIDPRYNLVMWAMPGAPGRIILYNWVLKRGAVIEMDVSALFTGFTANVSLEGLDALYPTGLDSIPISLDDASLAGGNPLLLVVNNSNIIGTLNGDNLAATVRIGNAEPTPGKRSRIRSLRPVTDATNATATVNARMRAGDAEGVVSAATMRSNGKMPIRANGRYNDVTITIPAGEAWSYLQGFEVEFEAGDGR
jgi:hypothetical protein